MQFIVLAVALAAASSANAITIKFVNKCSQSEFPLSRTVSHTDWYRTDVWAAVGQAPNGVPNRAIAWGQELFPGSTASYGVADTAVVSDLLLSIFARS
jgi:hypothetical protein